MTDEQIVRTLAEFMFETQVWKDDLNGNYYGEDPEDGTPFQLEAYLTSYDALAPVWRKVCFNAPKSNDGIVIAAMETLRRKHGVQDWGMWFTATPRDYAEALATAILSAKGESHADIP